MDGFGVAVGALAGCLVGADAVVMALVWLLRLVFWPLLVCPEQEHRPTTAPEACSAVAMEWMMVMMMMMLTLY